MSDDSGRPDLITVAEQRPIDRQPDVVVGGPGSPAPVPDYRSYLYGILGNPADGDSVFYDAGVGDWVVGPAAGDPSIPGRVAALEASAGGGGSVPAVAPLRYLIMGDSAAQNAGTAFDPATPVTGSTQSGNSFAAYTTFWSRGRAVLAHNAGVSGNTSAQLLARLTTDVINVVQANPDRFDVLVQELAGGNDFGAFDTATTIANLTAIYDALAALNKPVVVFTMYVRDAGSAGTLPSYAGGNYTPTAYFARVKAINAFIRDYVQGKPQFTLCDIHSGLVNPLTGAYRAGYSNDGTHTKAEGSSVVGRLLADALEAYMGADTGLAGSKLEEDLVTADYFFDGAASNDRQFVQMTGAPTGGTQTWAISPADAALYGVPAGSVTVAWNATGTTIQAAMEAVWGAGNVAVTGNSADGSGNWNHYVTWQGAYAARTMPLLTVTHALTGGSSPNVTSTKSVASGSQMGGVAAGWTVGLTGSGQVRCSVEARKDGYGYWQVIELLTGNDAVVSLSHSITSGAIQVGDRVYAEAELVATDDWIDPQSCEFFTQMLGAAGTRVGGVGNTTGISPSPGSFNPGPAQGVLRHGVCTSDQVVTFGGVQLNWQADGYSRIKVGRMGVRKAAA